RSVRSRVHEHPDAPHSHLLLRARRERPRSRAAEQRDEVASPQTLLRRPDHGPGVHPQAGRVPLTSRTIQISKHAPMKPAIRQPNHPARTIPNALKIALAIAAPTTPTTIFISSPMSLFMHCS